MNKYSNKSIIKALTFLKDAKTQTEILNHGAELARLYAAKHEIENAINFCREKIKSNVNAN